MATPVGKSVWFTSPHALELLLNLGISPSYMLTLSLHAKIMTKTITKKIMLQEVPTLLN